MFSLNEQHQTLDCFYSTRFLSLPRSIKCITQMSDVNPGFFCTSAHSLSCSAQTGYFSFSIAIWSVLWQCYFVPRTNYCLSSSLRAHSVYFLSLLNLWKKRASLLSCLPMIPLCIPVYYKEPGGEKSARRRQTNTFRSIMLRQFPLSFVGLFYLMFPHLRGG